MAEPEGTCVEASAITDGLESSALTINVLLEHEAWSRLLTIIESKMNAAPSKIDVGVTITSSSQATTVATPWPNSTFPAVPVLMAIFIAKTPPPMMVANKAKIAKPHFGFNLFFEDSKDPSNGELGTVLPNFN